jgi:hypothetical protein
MRQLAAERLTGLVLGALAQGSDPLRRNVNGVVSTSGFIALPRRT